MQQTDWKPDWDEIADWLQDANAVNSPAELQGHLAGRAVAGEPLSGDRGIAVIADCLTLETEVLLENERIWKEYAQSVAEDVEDDEYKFALLLPEDSQPLPIRLLALAQWCQGFLGGIGSVVKNMGDGLDESSKELLSDLAEISQLSVDEEESEENEVLYSELTEYARISVFNLAAGFRKSENLEESQTAGPLQ